MLGKGAMMTVDSFFNEQSEQSYVKTQIVSKYFDVWANVIIATQNRYPTISSNKIAYIDLFAGPGRYDDGNTSTPIEVLRIASEHPVVSQRLVAMFNDKDERNCRSLEEAITEIPHIKKLKFKPKVHNEEVGEELVKMFEEMKLIPTLFFVDPWGYKGLSLRLVNSVLKDWGCDCIFFFNYTRINMGLTNDRVREHMDALFGEIRAAHLRTTLSDMNARQREATIIEELCQAIKLYDNRYYVLPFRFKHSGGKRTSHHLIFVSKNFVGYEIMKGIMAHESSKKEDGVPSFEYNPRDSILSQQSLLFKLSSPLSELQDMLLEEFAGKSIKMIDIYKQHNVDTPYIKANYKDVLKNLEKKRMIVATPSARERKKNTFADSIIVKFP